MLGRVLGALLILVGLAFNKWTLEAAIILDGTIDSAMAESAIVSLQLVLIGAGTWMLVKAPRLRAPTAKQAVAVLVSVVFVLGMGEVCLRIINRGAAWGLAGNGNGREMRHSVNFEADSDTGWRMCKSREYQLTVDDHVNTYRSNSQGFRSEREFDEPHDSMFALAGDSFTWGFGVDYRDTFGALLEARWAGSLACNFAMQGFGIDQMWMSVRHQALPLHPDLVIVAFIDEDFERSLPSHKWPIDLEDPHFVQDSGVLRRMTPEDEPGWFRRMLQSNSMLWSMAGKAFEHLRPFGAYWSLNTAILDAIAADCRQQGVPLLVLRLPEKRAAPQPFEVLAAHLRSRRIEYLDLAGADVPPGIHFEKDDHINARGHRYVMEAISRWIEVHLPQLAGNDQTDGATKGY